MCPCQVIKIQAARRGVLGRRYAKEHKRHVSAARRVFGTEGDLQQLRKIYKTRGRIQSLVRTQKEQRIYDALRPSSCNRYAFPSSRGRSEGNPLCSRSSSYPSMFMDEQLHC